MINGAELAIGWCCGWSFYAVTIERLTRLVRLMKPITKPHVSELIASHVIARFALCMEASEKEASKPTRVAVSQESMRVINVMDVCGCLKGWK